MALALVLATHSPEYLPPGPVDQEQRCEASLPGGERSSELNQNPDYQETLTFHFSPPTSVLSYHQWDEVGWVAGGELRVTG